MIYIEVRDKAVYELLDGTILTHDFKKEKQEPTFTKTTMVIDGVTIKKKDIHKITLHYIGNQKPNVFIMHQKEGKDA